jgi:ferredoxin
VIDLGAMETCVFCPNLCRHVCPVAVGTGREATTPTAMVTIAWLGLGESPPAEVGPAEAMAAASLCVSCGACTAACVIERPVAALLADVRAAGPAAAVEAPPAIEEPAHKRAGIIAVECEGRSWSTALAGRLGEPVGRWITRDHLGEAAADHPSFAAHARRLRERVGDRRVIVSCLGCLRAARRAGLRVEHVAEVIDWQPGGQVHHPCDGPRLTGTPAPDALACCGACAPLSSAHPDVAAELGQANARHYGSTAIASPDARCAGWLRARGVAIEDPISFLLHTDRPQ